MPAQCLFSNTLMHYFKLQKKPPKPYLQHLIGITTFFKFNEKILNVRLARKTKQILTRRLELIYNWGEV